MQHRCNNAADEDAARRAANNKCDQDAAYHHLRRCFPCTCAAAIQEAHLSQSCACLQPSAAACLPRMQRSAPAGRRHSLRRVALHVRHAISISNSELASSRDAAAVNQVVGVSETARQDLMRCRSPRRPTFPVLPVDTADEFGLEYPSQSSDAVSSGSVLLPKWCLPPLAATGKLAPSRSGEDQHIHLRAT